MTRTSFCHHCGGTRNHIVLACVEEPAQVWSIVRCAGCDAVTFLREYWLPPPPPPPPGDDLDHSPSALAPQRIGLPQTESYPKFPRRKIPEWSTEFYLNLDVEESWLCGLHLEIYKALGMGLLSTASMGVRAIVDHIVTSRAEDDRANFGTKLRSLQHQGLISAERVAILEAAFDFGSAAAHRGHQPSDQDVGLLLDIAESLIDSIYMTPQRLAREARAAEHLKQRTPPRPPRRSPGHAKCTS